MLELRILSGYHRGATLPLDGEALSIGGDEDADVVLADPGLAAHHARLSAYKGNWLLEAVDGQVRGDQDNAAQEQIVLGEGSFARVGPIWITVCAADSGWQDPPPEPVDAPEPDEPEAPDDAPPDDDGMMDEAAMNEFADDEAMDEAGRHEAQAQTAQQEPQRAADVAPARRSRAWRMIFIPVTAVAVLSAAAAYAYTSQPDAASEALLARQAAEQARLAALPLRLPSEQLQAALRKRLGEIDLLSRVTLELEVRSWTISGSLNEEEVERLQRMLRSFSERHVIDFPIQVRLGNPESMLPFRISQVMSGHDPSIITDDGRRLYVGDEYRGVRLAAVAGNQLRFTGKHNLDIVW